MPTRRVFILVSINGRLNLKAFLTYRRSKRKSGKNANLLPVTSALVLCEELQRGEWRVSMLGLAGAIDMHLHSGPHLFDRGGDSLEIAKRCEAAGLGAVVV